jgi:hypothetical protein
MCEKAVLANACLTALFMWAFKNLVFSILIFFAKVMWLPQCPGLCCPNVQVQYLSNTAPHHSLAVQPGNCDNIQELFRFPYLFAVPWTLDKGIFVSVEVCWIPYGIAECH